jgi:hypothetical protein
MKIDFEDTKIILVDDGRELKSSHQSQLFFWGFTKTSDLQYVSEDENPTTLLQKVYGYLQKNLVVDEK